VLARRLLLLAAVLMLLAALAAGLAPQPAQEVPPTEQSQLPAGGRVVEEISAAPGADSRVVVRRGDVLALEVSGDTNDSVLIERLDRIESIDPTTPARFELLADAPAGVYPLRLIESDRRIGSIEIRN
jgi:protein-disulfide isomerase